ncbi:immunoglobulin-like domain-containing protein [Rummeliibacillus sp. JY-2-4R]
MKSKLFLFVFLTLLFVLPTHSFAEENNSNSANNELPATTSYVLELPTNLKTLEVKKKVNLSLIKNYTDGKKETIISNVNWAITDESYATINGNQLTTKKLGTIKLTAVYEGDTKSFSIKIVDKTKPKLTGVSNKTINLNSKFSAKTGINAVDNYDGNITKKVIVKGTVNIKKTGKYTITYTVSDSSGNKTVMKRIITVKKPLKSNFRCYKDKKMEYCIHKNLGDSKRKQLYKDTIILIPAMNGDYKGMGMEAYTGNLTVKKVTIVSKGKKLTLQLTNGAIWLNASQIKYFKENVSTKYKAKVQFTTSQKTVTKYLSKKEISALSDAVNLFNEW